MVDRKIKVGVIGAGPWGRNVIKTCDELGVLAAVAENNQRSHKALSEHYPDVALYDEHRTLLATDVDAVLIATPVVTHHRVGLDALRAGKDVFIEKPMAVSTTECDELIALADSQQSVLMIGHMLLYQPAVDFIKKFIADGKLGKIYSLNQVRRNLGTVRTHENALYSLGVHDIAVLDYLIGGEISDLQVDGQSIITSGVEDTINLHLTYQSGIKAHLNVSWLWPEKERNLMIIGELGSLYFDELTNQVTHIKSYIKPDNSASSEGREIVYQGASSPLTLEIKHFLNCLQTRDNPRSCGSQGRRVVEVLEKASAMLTAEKTPLDKIT